jgi:hypothetical protein
MSFTNWARELKSPAVIELTSGSAAPENALPVSVLLVLLPVAALLLLEGTPDVLELLLRVEPEPDMVPEPL